MTLRHSKHFFISRRQAQAEAVFEIYRQIAAAKSRPRL
jgi:hypothetical protein